MARRHALRDDQWDRINDLLPGREGAVGVTAKDNRLFVEAVLYRYRTGIPWRDLPERFGDAVAVYSSPEELNAQIDRLLSDGTERAGTSRDDTECHTNNNACHAEIHQRRTNNGAAKEHYRYV